MRMRKRNVTKDERELIIKLYKKGISYSTIARRVGRQVGSICSVITNKRQKPPEFPQVTKNPDSELSWGRGFYDDNLSIKSGVVMSALRYARKIDPYDDL